MQVDCVLSSGLLLFQLTVEPTCTVASLKQQVIKSMFAGNTYSYKFYNPLIMPAFKTTPWEPPWETIAFLRQYKPQLCRYKAALLSDTTVVSSIQTAVCVLRPSDLLVRGIDLEGNVTSAVFNTCEDIQWTLPGPIQSSAIQILILTSASENAICQVASDETVHTLKGRIAGYMNTSMGAIKIWYHEKLLRDDQTLERCGVKHRSRLVAVGKTEMLGIGYSIDLKRTVFPISELKLALKHVQILEPEWCVISVCAFQQLYPDSNSHFKHFLITNKSSRIISLILSPNTSLQALIPAPCTLQTAKVCISAQHNLPAELISLGFATALDMNKVASEYGLSEGETLTVSRCTFGQWKIELKVQVEKLKSINITTNSSDLVGKIKDVLRKRRPTLGTSIALVRGCDVLEDGKSLGYYSLPQQCSIYATSSLPISPLTQISLEQYRFIPPEEPRQRYTASQFSVDLFDSDQDPKALSRIERTKRYSNWLQDPANIVKIVAPGQLLNVKVHKKATVSVVKAYLKQITHETAFKLTYNGVELKDEETLDEQGIGQDATLLLIPLKTICISVQTASQQHIFPVALHTGRLLQTIDTAIPTLAEAPAYHRSYKYARRLVGDGEVLPPAVGTYEMKLAVGRGAEVLLRTAQGTMLRLEVNPTDNERDIRSRLEGMGTVLWFS